MDLKDAIRSIIKPHDKDPMTQLTTPFGESLDPDHVLSEYPRPQLERKEYTNLNGYWDYAFCTERRFPDAYMGKILVPFSPEAFLSGVGRQLQPEEYLWYRRFLSISSLDLLRNEQLILHFGAVDYEADVFLNGNKVCSHKGGYLPFSCNITHFLEAGENELAVRVHDPSDNGTQSRGKQILKRGGIFYTAQSGIWQTVWMEWIPATHIEGITIDVHYDSREICIEADTVSYDAMPLLTLTVLDPVDTGNVLYKKSIQLQADIRNVHQRIPQYGSYDFSFQLSEEMFHAWSPETPFLYPITLTLSLDEVKSYFAVRTYTIEKKDDKPVFCLNHQPYFLMGVLDQGYWPDGLYTAPSDEALIYDITTMKNLGFTMLRKHIKIESARWYYHCDRLGMIVCQDMVNGGGKYRMPLINYLPTIAPSSSQHISDEIYSLFAREDKKSREEWEEECYETVDYLQFFPSIAIWCPFNEGWGQFDSLRISEAIKSIDPTRLVDAASGWFDQGGGDFISIHNYFRPLRVSVKKWADRAFFLSEYGGYACHLKGHTSVDRIFGYKRYDTTEEFQAAYHELIEKSLLPLKKQGLSGAVYTQVSDVEEEVNGILTYDRKINKLTS